MKGSVKFGWRVPTFPLDGSRGGTFRDQIYAYLDAIHGRFASAWVGDHFFVAWHEALESNEGPLGVLDHVSPPGGQIP